METAAVTKHSLAFILDHRPPCVRDHGPSVRRRGSASRPDASVAELVQALLSHRHTAKRPYGVGSPCQPRARKRVQSTEEKRLARQCTVDGCANYTIDRGLCFRHGGGKTCSLDGCERSAKARGLCWRHGGSIRCSVADCPRGAKSRGLCWSHGGGKRCAHSDCDEVVTRRRGTLCARHEALRAELG